MEEVEDKLRSWWETQGLSRVTPPPRPRTEDLHVLHLGLLGNIMYHSDRKCAANACYVKVSWRSKWFSIQHFKLHPLSFTCSVYLETFKNKRIWDLKCNSTKKHSFLLLENTLLRETKVTKKYRTGSVTLMLPGLMDWCYKRMHSWKCKVTFFSWVVKPWIFWGV